jgi:uncharacterized membrane-anchored protein YhcB (DUF1043 family)
MYPTSISLLWFAAGALAGLFVAAALRRRAGRVAEERTAQLEAELIETRAELEAQGDRIEAHFARTSDLFRDLTQRYTELYAHLADGARDFCSHELPAIARGLDGLLPSGDGERESPGRPERVNGGSPPPA